MALAGKKRNQTRVVFDLTDQQMALLDALAKQWNCNRAEALRRALELYAMRKG